MHPGLQQGAAVLRRRGAACSGRICSAQIRPGRPRQQDHGAGWSRIAASLVLMFE